MWPRGQRQIPKLNRVLFLNLFNPVSATLVHRSTAATRERTPARSHVLPVRYRSRHSQRGTGRVTVMGESPHYSRMRSKPVPWRENTNDHKTSQSQHVGNRPSALTSA